jgi:hypothetical protein
MIEANHLTKRYGKTIAVDPPRFPQDRGKASS